MPGHFTISPAARQDLVELADYLARESWDLATRFLAAAVTTFEFLVERPAVGELCEFEHPEAADVRVWQIKGFPNHLAFNRASDPGVHIVRVIHGARDIAAIFSLDD